MAGEDHLDRETSVAGELTATGVKATAKSRFVAAVDRLGGNLIELLNAPIESRITTKRALSEGRVRIIEAATAIGIERLKTDPEFADRAMRSHLDSIFEKQLNKDSVLEKTIEDLRRQPPSDAEATTGAETVDDAFMTRFERYAEEASSDELREKWGRVLAAKIRNPNHISIKVLRVIDELDSETALLFERVCEHRLAGNLFKATLGKLSYKDVVRLVSADLIVDPGMLGQILNSIELTDSAGINQWFWALGSMAVGITKSMRPPTETEFVITTNDGAPALPVYILTDVGLAISSILPDRTSECFHSMTAKLAAAANRSTLRKYIHVAEGNWRVIETVPAIDVDN